MARVNPRGQQPKRRDYRKIDIVADGHELRRLTLVQARQLIFVPRIDLLDLRVLVNDLGLVIAQLIDLMRDFVVVLLLNEYPN